MAYQFHGFRRGNTNGQNPTGTVIVSVDDKALGAKLAVEHLGCYKVTGYRLGKKTDLAAKAKELSHLFGHSVAVI